MNLHWLSFFHECRRTKGRVRQFNNIRNANSISRMNLYGTFCSQGSGQEKTDKNKFTAGNPRIIYDYVQRYCYNNKNGLTRRLPGFRFWSGYVPSSLSRNNYPVTDTAGFRYSPCLMKPFRGLCRILFPKLECAAWKRLARAQTTIVLGDKWSKLYANSVS